MHISCGTSRGVFFGPVAVHPSDCGNSRFDRLHWFCTGDRRWLWGLQQEWDAVGRARFGSLRCARLTGFSGFRFRFAHELQYFGVIHSC